MSKTVYLAGQARQTDAVRIPVDRERTAYVRFIPEDAAVSGGLPAWVDEACAQVFTPTEDVNTTLTFDLTGMTKAPDLILVGCSNPTGEHNLDFGGGVYLRKPFGLSDPLLDNWRCWTAARTGNSGAGYTWQYYTTDTDGVSSASATAFSINTRSYGSTRCYWRAGWTYTVVAIRLKTMS